MVAKGTIKIPQSSGSELTAEVLTDIKCPTCGQKPDSLTEAYRQLGEEAAEVLYSGTPGAFWQAIADFAIEQALRKGTVQRPLKAEDITQQW